MPVASERASAAGRGRAARAGAIGAALVALAVSASCSPTQYDYEPCQAHAHCRQAFGFGSICGKAGLCEPTFLHSRCDTAYPEDLLRRRDLYRDAIVFGSLMDRSSPAHVVREKAIRLAVKEVSERGDLEGRPLGVVFCNTEAQSEGLGYTRTEASIAAARYLVDKLGVPALVGPSASTDAEQVWSDLRTSGTLILSPSATSPALDHLEQGLSDDQPGLLWRVAPSDLLQGRVIAEDLLARNVRQAAIVREAGAYGEGLASLVTQHLVRAGGGVQIFAAASAAQIPEAAALAADASAPEVLFISSQQEWIIKFLAAAGAQAGFASKSIFLTDAAANEAVLRGAAAAASLFGRIRGTRPAPRDRNSYVYASFIAGYKAEYPGEDPTVTAFSAHAYDGAWLVMYGSAWSLLREGRVTGAGIARGLRQVSDGAATPLIPSSWLGVLSAFREGQPVDVSGASGELDFDPATRQIVAPIEVWTVAAGPPAFITRAAPAGPAPEVDPPPARSSR